MAPKADIVDRLRAWGAELSGNGLCEEAAEEIEALRFLVDQAGVTIAKALLEGLQPLPWSIGHKLKSWPQLFDAKREHIGSIYGNKALLTAETIVALVNQAGAP
jgi:hypothetical protein